MNEPVPRTQIAAWWIYDLANTIYSALFITFFFPLFIKNYAGGNEGHVGLVITISTLLSAVMVPLVGALSDQYGRRMPFLILFTIACCAATVGVGVSSLQWALVLAVFSNFFYSISLAVYDALLPKLAPPEKQGSVSGWGVGIGYLGTPISLVAVSILMYFLGWDTEAGVRATFWLTAALFLGFALFPFLAIKEPRIASQRSVGQEIQAAFSDVWKAIRALPGNPPFLLFLISAFLFFNAIMAVVVFLFLFGEEELGLSAEEFVGVYAGLAFAAAFGAGVSGKLTDWLGPKLVLMLSALLWIAVILTFLQFKNMAFFIGAGMVGGMAMAAYQTAVRPLLIQFADPEKMGEYFGFLALINKASGAVGPLVFGQLVAMFSYNAGLWALLVFFIVGIGCLWFVPDQRSRFALPGERK